MSGKVLGTLHMLFHLIWTSTLWSCSISLILHIGQNQNKMKQNPEFPRLRKLSKPSWLVSDSNSGQLNFRSCAFSLHHNAFKWHQSLYVMAESRGWDRWKEVAPRFLALWKTKSKATEGSLIDGGHSSQSIKRTLSCLTRICQGVGRKEGSHITQLWWRTDLSWA